MTGEILTNAITALAQVTGKAPFTDSPSPGCETLWVDLEHEGRYLIASTQHLSFEPTNFPEGEGVEWAVGAYDANDEPLVTVESTDLSVATRTVLQEMSEATGHRGFSTFHLHP